MLDTCLWHCILEAGEFPAQMANYAENVSIWWRHHVRVGVSPFYVTEAGFHPICGWLIA